MMKSSAAVFLLALILALIPLSARAGYTWTDQTAAGSRNWGVIASSSDGSHLAAGVYPGDIYTSTDTGSSWTDQTAAGSRNWAAIASSSDGTHLAAVCCGAADGDIYTSTDSGSTWTDQTAAGSRWWFSIASSSDGTHLAAAVLQGDIYTSTDSGSSWTDQTAAGSRMWEEIASSADGSHLAATVDGGYIYTSTDYGSTWTAQTAAGSQSWYAIVSSSDGSHLAAVLANGGDVYISTDSGATWTDQNATGTQSWYGLAMSSDGSHLAAVDGGCPGDIWTSTDSGNSWTDQTAAGSRCWAAIASSTDGTHLAAVDANPGDIWTGIYFHTLAGTSCSVGAGVVAGADPTGNNVICNGTDWEYPAYIIGDTGVGGSTASCSSSNAGMLIWNGSALEICNGTSFQPLVGSTSSDTNFAYLDANQSFTQGQANSLVAEGTQTAGGTLTPDFSAGNDFTATFGAGNLTIANPTNIAAGQCGFLALTQDSTGSRTVTWGSDWHWPGGTAPTLSSAASATDIIDYCAITTSFIAAEMEITNVQ